MDYTYRLDYEHEDDLLPDPDDIQALAERLRNDHGEVLIGMEFDTVYHRIGFVQGRLRVIRRADGVTGTIDWYSKSNYPTFYFGFMPLR